MRNIQQQMLENEEPWEEGGESVGMWNREQTCRLLARQRRIRSSNCQDKTRIYWDK